MSEKLFNLSTAFALTFFGILTFITSTFYFLRWDGTDDNDIIRKKKVKQVQPHCHMKIWDKADIADCRVENQKVTGSMLTQTNCDVHNIFHWTPQLSRPTCPLCCLSQTMLYFLLQ